MPNRLRFATSDLAAKVRWCRISYHLSVANHPLLDRANKIRTKILLEIVELLQTTVFQVQNSIINNKITFCKSASGGVKGSRICQYFEFGTIMSALGAAQSEGLLASHNFWLKTGPVKESAAYSTNIDHLRSALGKIKVTPYQERCGLLGDLIKQTDEIISMSLAGILTEETIEYRAKSAILGNILVPAA